VPVREQLIVNGRDRSKLLDSVTLQAAAVRVALRTFHDTGVTGQTNPSSRSCALTARIFRCSARLGSAGFRCSGPKAPPNFCVRRPDPSMRARWPLSIDTSLKQCRRPDERPAVFLERRLSVAESGSAEDDLRLVLILPDGLREDRFARGPQAFDRCADGGANDLGIELVVVMADQVTHPRYVGPRDTWVALTQAPRQGLDGIPDREDATLDGIMATFAK
jgi:hypothetical protein